MKKIRKTIEVATVKAQVNGFLKDSSDSRVGERNGHILLLEGLLMSTGNYQGFVYLGEADMETSIMGNSVGINPVKDGKGYEDMTRFENTDDTRRVYV